MMFLTMLIRAAVWIIPLALLCWVLSLFVPHAVAIGVFFVAFMILEATDYKASKAEFSAEDERVMRNCEAMWNRYGIKDPDAPKLEDKP